MAYRPTALFRRARHIFQTEGLIPLLRTAFNFLAPYLFQYDTYYLYEHVIKERKEADFMPTIQGFTVHIVTSNEQADKLAADGFDPRSHSVYSRGRLDKGAIALCIFVGRELAHIGWMAMSQEAKDTFDSLPYKVDFSHKEACTGATVTIPKYRGNGLMTYGYFKRFQYLWERGITISRNAVATNNIASQRVHAKFGPRIYARARYLKVLKWKFWKETPITPSGHQE